MPKYPAYVALAQNPKTGECEWSIYTGVGALESATYRVNKWCEQEGWIGFIRPTDEPVSYHRS